MCLQGPQGAAPRGGEAVCLGKAEQELHRNGRMAKHEHLERINAYPQQELVRRKNKAVEEKPGQEQNGASGKRHSCFSARGKETSEQYCWA